MIGGNVHEFWERIYSGQDTVFIFEGIKYWFQGYNIDSGDWHIEIVQTAPIDNSNHIWSFEASTIEECVEAFEKAPLWNGKTFWEVESEIEWVDE